MDSEDYNDIIEDDNAVNNYDIEVEVEENIEETEKNADVQEGSDSSDESDDDEHGTVVYTAGGIRMWRPKVEPQFLPDVDDGRFHSETDAVNMYALYAKEGGFVERKGTTRKFPDYTIKQRHVICNRASKITEKTYDSTDKNVKKRKRRNCNSIANDCKARIIFERDGMYTPIFKIKEFQDLHNHPLQSIEERVHSKKYRRLSYKDKEFIVRASRLSLGATMAHKLRVCLQGGYDMVGPEVEDYKNFRLKMGNIIGDKDAQIVVDMMNGRKEDYDNLTFEYKCERSVLNAMFWADDTDKLYYKEFGDVISFDATFRTNKYGMVFVPFTAIDNHKRSITVGAGLLSNESIESYKWLLKSFLIAHGKQPRVVLTDQDAAMQQAISTVFPESIHRLCMWHIMKKVNAKVAKDSLDNTDFRKRFNKLVWNIYLEPKEFEEQWTLLINEYELEDRRWFIDMYNKRDSWIPAFFKDVPMHGLMKTTSRSESCNSFFNKYAHYGNLLIYFMMNYDTAIEKQRNNVRRRDKATKTAQYKLETPSGLEKHASNIYTKTMFFEVQKEIVKGAWQCLVESVETTEECQIVVVNYMDKNEKLKGKFKVQLNLTAKKVKCSCGLFTRVGLLCRHAFAVLKNNGIQEIPDEYILKRWRKDAIESSLLLRKLDCSESTDDNSKLILEAYRNFEFCLDAVKGDKEKLLAFVENTRLERNKAEGVACTLHEEESDEEEVSKLLGVSIPKTIEIHNPQGIRNKGCGTKVRISSANEKGSSSKKGKTRICSGCNVYVNHNWRTCPVRIARDEAEKKNKAAKI